jgi:hypothetical protein
MGDMENKSGWQLEIEQQFQGEAAAEYTQMIADFLRDEPGNVLREFTSELILNLRAIRNFAQRAQQESDPVAKAVVLFKTSKDGVETAVTAEEFVQTLLDRIAEAKQLAECMKVYAMALQEDASARPYPEDRH